MGLHSRKKRNIWAFPNLFPAYQTGKRPACGCQGRSAAVASGWGFPQERNSPFPNTSKCCGQSTSRITSAAFQNATVTRTEMLFSQNPLFMNPFTNRRDPTHFPCRRKLPPFGSCVGPARFSRTDPSQCQLYITGVIKHGNPFYPMVLHPSRKPDRLRSTQRKESL